MKNRSIRAFTLVELSIVLVIIGLIIGGVLTGQQIIENARITNSVNAIQAYQAAFQSYAQNYGVLPGDDPSATRRFTGSSGVSANGNGDGTLDGVFDTSTTTDESRLTWAELRAAGFVKNQVTSGTTAVQPQNPFGGIYGFQNGAFNSSFSTPVLCLNNVPSDAAQTIDTKLDDGLTDSGSVRGSSTSATTSPDTSSTTSSGYSANATYVVCIKM